MEDSKPYKLVFMSYDSESREHRSFPEQAATLPPIGTFIRRVCNSHTAPEPPHLDGRIGFWEYTVFGEYVGHLS